ncbi:HAMP domain-containing sensor histidine kinase [Lentzea flaviverrucosa]|uniref:histidine kinase n=1 Tax=Lentzea flaviverrucosa TaxID=200379 RepID=A0A1H9XWK3_9PSEU|nr:HAMP domain-containing sensor histidine kinase [Lentzea flaviverrucosa]RDI34308.1 two-component system sensor histidine kinase BaeS [Lentzea flaviverrucosa]SES50521.1 two-component system, OmpR family, sensor histidine kinase BaeS [Lentzea flaviverrucosa]
MTRDDNAAWGPLSRRLLAAFVLVALSSVVVLTGAALWGTGRGLEAAEATARRQAAERVAAAVAAAYSAAGGWDAADLRAATDLATGADAHLVVRTADGANVSGRGRGMPMNTMPGSGRIQAPVVVGGAAVGSVQLAFGSPVTSAVRDIAWGWIGLAAGVALMVAGVVTWFVGRRIVVPLTRLTRAARRISAGDRTARAGVEAPGELGELATAFDHMAAEVARVERARRDLTGDVAHELRTPLATLQAGLEELRDGLAPPDAERLTSLHDQAQRLGRIVQDLAELSEAEAAALSLRLRDADLAEVVGTSVEANFAHLRAAGLEVRTELATGVVVRADPDRLHQALGNLLANCARYARPGDVVTVRVRRSAGTAFVEVRDTGPGIPAEELERVFERRWRGCAGRTVAGTGIGLAVVKELVTAHGGTVAATSGAGGTLFTLSLPL